MHFQTIDSTNKYALENIAKLSDRTVISSNEQTGGRGRLDRKWQSPPDVNIYCSIILKNLTDKPAMLTVLAALAVMETLRKYDIPAQLKWPNDVLVNQKKICGILAEANADGLVIGIGLNVNMDISVTAPTSPLRDGRCSDRILDIERSRNVRISATSMLAETGQTFDQGKILNEILENFFIFYDHALAQGFASLMKIWQNELNIIGKKVQVQTVQKTFYGTVTQIDDGGALMIETTQGIEKVLAGDVHVA